MPDPTVSHALHITSGSNTDAGATVIVENITKIDTENPDKHRQIVNLDSNNKASVDLANLKSGYDDGDSIRIKATGIRVGVKYYIVDAAKGSNRITLSETSADYAGGSINL